MRHLVGVLNNNVLLKPLNQHSHHPQSSLTLILRNLLYLYTDASTIGLGAALMQYDERHKLQPLGYASRTLNAAESNYSTTHLEVLAVVWALKHFRELIHDYEIHVRTDHAAVVELFNAKSLTGKLARWALTVQDFHPTFTHVPGAVNNVADSLSRYIGAVTEETEIMLTDTDADLNERIRSAQRHASFCKPIIYFLESGDDTQLPELPVPLPEFALDDGLLVRHTHLTSNRGPQRNYPGSCSTKTCPNYYVLDP